MPPFAKGTTVPVEKSRMEVDRYLNKRGAEAFATMSDAHRFVLQFRLKDRSVRFVVPTPAWPKTGTADQRKRVVERELQRRWRALLLVLKAKFESIDSGITTFDQEFLAQMVAGDGRTVGEILVPEIEAGRLAGSGSGWLALPPGGGE